MGPLAHGTLVGRYRIDGPLGRGGMAIVYEATHESLGRPVALKVLGPELGSDPEFAQRFRREGKLQASLEHPHVVTIYESGESAHGLYLAMRLVRGPTLAAILLDGVLGADRAMRLLGQVAQALDAAHAAGLVHRDVKPKNVLVGEHDHAYLADFGLTKLGGDTGMTVTGQLIGTLAYLAPEVIRGEPATPASDLYAFAAMVFECLSGGPVFPRATQAAQLYAHTSEPPPQISRRRAALPPTLDPVFERALAKHPAQRPRDAVALMSDIADALRGIDLAELGPPPPPEPAALGDTTIEPLTPAGRSAPRSRGRARTVAMIAAAALAGAALTAVVALLNHDSRGPANATVAVPPAEPGTLILGNDLSRPGRSRDCRGGPVRVTSVGCTIAQATLPGATLVVPQTGVVRRWAVRSARGELALSALRPRGGGFFQTAFSRTEFIGNDGVYVFHTDLAVERGDLLAVHVVPGSGIGARAAVPGATTNRWIPPNHSRRPPDLPAGSGFDSELLLRVELSPGRQPTLPRQVTGSAVAALPAGHVVRRTQLHYTNGRPVEVALVALPGRFALDLWRSGQRVARMDVPDFRPRNGRLLTFEVEREPTESEVVNILLEYVNEDSARILSHFAVAYAREFEFVN